MAALQLLRDGAAIAAELAALLFLAPLPPAAAAEPAGAAEALQPVAAGRLAALHVTDAAFEVRLLGLLADVRFMQTVRNDGAVRVDLGSHLPVVVENVDELALARNGSALDLVGSSACGGDFDDGDDPDGGHVRTNDDEARADLLQLLPGQWVTVAVSATATMEPWGEAWRLQLPATIVSPAAQVRVVRHSAGSALVVVPPADAAGHATLTVRPDNAVARTVELGRVTPGFAHVIPLDVAGAGEPATLELEIVSATRVQWITLATPASPVTLAHGAQ